MASLKQRRKRDGALASQFWWVKWKDPITQKIKEQSTGCVIGRAEDMRRALRIKAQKVLLELSAREAIDDHRFAQWVPTFLQQHYSNARTLQRMQSAWFTLEIYLNEVSVFSPEQLRRECCQNYVSWRANQYLKSKTKPVHRNTIIQELKLLGFLQQEAVQRGWIEFNCAHRLGVERDRVQHRGEILPEHERLIRAALAQRLRRAIASGDPKEKRNADFLNVSFNIAILSGMRQAETHFHLRDQVNFRDRQITLRAKGKRDYTAPMSPALDQYLRELIQEGRTWTYDAPRMGSLVWWKFMDKLRAKHPELKHVHFHGTRSAVISRLEEAGAPEKVVMGMVNHASTTVHRRYRQVRQRELDAYWHAISPGAATAAAAPVPKKRKRRPDISP